MLRELYERRLQQQKINIVLTLFGALFLSLVMSCQELNYMISGKTDTASTITRIQNERDKYGNLHTKRVLGWSYHDGATLRQKYIDVPLDEVVPPTLTVQYLPGRDISRPYGQHHYGWVALFFGSLALSILGAIWLAKGESS